MTWTRHSDDYADRPAIMGLSDAAYRAHDAALIWSNRQLTNGQIPDLAIPVILAYVRGDQKQVIKELEGSDLWRRVRGGWEIDWADQEDSGIVLDRRDRNTRRQAEYRERSSRHRSGDHSMCDPDKCRAAKAEGNASRNGPRNGERNTSRNGAPSHPIPSHPLPSSNRGRRGGTDATTTPEGGSSASALDGDTWPRYDDDWKREDFRPRDYLLDSAHLEEGGWDGGAWIQPSVWRDGWSAKGMRPAREGDAA